MRKLPNMYCLTKFWKSIQGKLGPSHLTDHFDSCIQWFEQVVRPLMLLCPHRSRAHASSGGDHFCCWTTTHYFMHYWSSPFGFWTKYYYFIHVGFEPRTLLKQGSSICDGLSHRVRCFFALKIENQRIFKTNELVRSSSANFIPIWISMV